MTQPTASSPADRNGRPGLHQRLLARRLRVMDGRVSEYAADRWLRYMECRLVAYLGVLVLMAAIVACALLNQEPAALGCLAASMGWNVAWSVAGYRYGRAACIDIVRAKGLPDHAWRKVRSN